MRRRLVAVGLVLASVLVAGACSVWGPEGGPGGAGLAAPTDTTAPLVVATAGPDGVQRVAISVGDDLRFTPSLVQAQPGVVEFVFHNGGMTPHDVQVNPGDESTGPLGAGESRTLRVTVSQPGRYPFPCLYHVSSGMTGTLEVL